MGTNTRLTEARSIRFCLTHRSEEARDGIHKGVCVWEVLYDGPRLGGLCYFVDAELDDPERERR